MVVSKLDEEVLRRVALLSDGAYIRSTNQSLGLAEIVAKINDTEKKEFSAAMFEEYDEQYRGFLAAALALMVFGWAMLARKNRLLASFNIFRRERE
jgi:Ca-activated chloride channel family protein